ncbi:MAG: hypothetical protein GY798_00380 [Hyphomicrobiales bacterium]|nr:hypothetical protein [Hyphomicrobiales bacterium]
MGRVFRYLLWVLGGLVAVVALVLVLLATPPGRSVLASIIERAASGGGLALSIGTLSGWPPFAFGADRIVLADTNGTFAEIDGLSVDVDVGALLTGQIGIESIDANRVALARQPVLESSGDSSSGSMVPLTARALSIARLELGADLVGRPAALAVAGAFASDSDGALQLRLKAERIDGTTGTLAADVDRAAGDTPIAVDLTVEEAADGILVGLTGRDSGPGYRLVAQTSLADGGFDGAVSLTSDGDARFAGQFGFTGADDAYRLTLSGEGDLAELVPVDLAGIVSGRIEVAADIGWSGMKDGALPRITVRDTAVSTDTVRLSASGAFGPPDAELSFKLDAKRPDGEAIALPVGEDPITIGSLALSGRIAPHDGGRRLDLVGRVTGLSSSVGTVPGIGLSLALESDDDNPFAEDSVPFAARVEADVLDLPAGRITATDAAPVLLTADGTLDLSDLSAKVNAYLSIAGGRALFSGEGSSEQLSGEAKLRFGDLTALSALAGRALSGTVSATATGTFFGPEGIELQIAGTANDLDPGEATAASLLVGDTKFELAVADFDNGISLSDVSVKGAEFLLGGDLSLTADQINGTVSGEVVDLAALAPQSTGAATFSVDVAGALDTPTFDARLGIAEGSLVGQPISGASLRVSGEPIDAGWRGKLALDGAFAGGPLSGTAEAILETDTGRFSLPQVSISVAENSLTGAVEQTPDGFLTGTLSLEAPDLKTLAALALLEASGSAEGQVDFATDGGKQTVALAFTGRGVVVETVIVDEAEGEVRIDDVFGTPRIAGSADASGIAAGSLQLNSAKISATVDGGSTRFSATARGPDIDLSGSGSLAADGTAQVLRIDSLSGKLSGLDVATDGPATVRLGDTVSIDNVMMAIGGGRVAVSGQASPQLNLDVRIDNVSASIADAFSPGLGAEGTITGQATATGSTDNPKIAWQADWSGFAVAESRASGLPGLSVTAKGEAATDATTIDARLAGGGLALDVSGNIPFSGADPQIRAQGSAPLELLGLVTDRELELGGVARIDLTISSLSAISGTVSVSNGTIVDAETKFGVADIAGEIRLDGQTATIARLTGRMAQGGTITVAGSVTIDPDAGLPTNLTIDVRDGRYSDGTTIDATYSASLGLSGPMLTTGKVTGRIDIARAEVLLPDSFGGGPALNVEHINVEPGFVPPVKPAPPRTVGGPQAAGGLALDITVASANRSAIIVRGFGLDASLGGSLRITGTTNSLVTVGGFEMLRGRIDVLGRRFDFTRGRLTFAGELVPILDFEATTRASDITATVRVTGPADNPQIELSSSPELPEEEIISHLLFDTNVGSLTAFQAAQLVDAIAQFSGAFARGDGLFARARKITGLDDLDVRQNESGGTTVGIGKRINDNIRLGVEQDTRGSGRVIIDLDLTRNLKARGEAGDDGSGKIGLTFEREY